MVMLVFESLDDFFLAGVSIRIVEEEFALSIGQLPSEVFSRLRKRNKGI